MKRKLLLSLVVLVCFLWSVALADTAPGRTDNTGDRSDESKIAAEMEKDRLERERLAAREAANEVSAAIRAKKEKLPLEQTDDIEKEKNLETLKLEKKASDEEAFKLALPSEIINLDQYELDKTRLLELEAMEYLTGEEAIEYKNLHLQIFPQSPMSRPHGGGSILVQGDDCSDPIVVELDVIGLPYVDAGQTNCARIDNYFDTCLGSYDSGEDIIYEIIVGTAGDYEITMDPLGTTWTGLLIDDACPPGGLGECIDYDTGTSGVRSFIVNLAAGTYYIMVDTWAAPDCIPAFNLTIDTYVVPTGRCCYNDFADCADGMPEPDCLAQPGNPIWDEGLNCTDNPCAAPVGRCCYNDYADCGDLAEADCLALPGNPVWDESLTCAENPCPTIPANDDCADAILVDVPSSTYGSTVLANPDTAPYCGTGDGTGGGVWYTVVGTGNTMTATLCDEFTDYDTKIRVYCNSCEDLMCAAGDDDDPECTYSSLRSTAIWCSIPGQTYYILVHGYSSNTGNYVMHVFDDGTSCEDPPACEPPTGRCCYDDPVQCLDTTEDECLNIYAGSWAEGLTCLDDPCPGSEGNDCANPIVVDLDLVGLPYNDNGQTTCGRLDDYFDTCLGYYDGGEDIIYEIIVGTADDYEITVDPLGTTYSGILIDDTCPAGGTDECIGYLTGYSSDPKVMQVYLEPGTYYIMIDTWAAPDCIPAFNLTIDTYVPPSGRCCYNYFADCAELTEAECLTQPGVPVWAEGLDCTNDPCAVPPIGRCCYDYFASCADMIELECSDQTGAPVWDEGLTCTNDPCPTPSEGDHCGNPFIIEESFPYSTDGNTCGYTDFCDITYGDNSEVIYQLEITSTVDLTVSLCGSSYDTKLAVFLNDCCTGAGTEFAYNDDSCGLQSEISTNFPPGLYYIVVDGYGSYCGDYVLNIDVYVAPVGRCCYDDMPCEDNVTESYCTDAIGEWDEDLNCAEFPCAYPPPDNDICDTAIPLSGALPIMAYGNTELAVNDYGPFEVEPACWQGNWYGTSGAAADVVYTWVVPADGTYRISLCGSTYDTVLLLYNNVCPPFYPDDFICGNDDTPDCGVDSELLLPLTAGQELMIVVDGYSSSSGNYILTIDEIVGACCVDEECVGTISESDCLSQGGSWYVGQSCPEFDCALDCLTQVPNQVDGIFSDLDCGECTSGLQLLAENFVIPNETDVLSLVFWGGYFPDNIIMETDDFSIIFLEDNAGVPGAEITAITNVSADDKFDTGVDLFGVDEYQYTIDISAYGVHLLPGTYFVEILNNTVENTDSWFWETGDLDLIVGVPGQAWTSTLPEEPWNYDAETDMALYIVCEGGGGACGSYVVGDYNGSELFNVADIIAAFSKLKTGSPDADLLCECPPGDNAWAVAMDVNNSCAFNVADVIAGFSKLKTGSPELVPCELCPPDGSPSPDGDQPLIVPNLESKAKLSAGSGME